MTVFVNGSFVPEAQATIPVFDRGFLYGDALFETVPVHDGQLFLWDRHWARLEGGARAVGITMPISSQALRETACELIHRNTLSNAVVRVTLSRGCGIRGYSPRGADRPTLVMFTAPSPPLDTPRPRWRLHTASRRLPAGKSMAAHKTTSKWVQVLARAEAEDAGADEALLLNTDGRIAEAAAANVFWFAEDRCHTPPLEDGGLAGVTRAWVLDLVQRLGWTSVETSATADALLGADGVFLTLSSLGVVEACSLDGRLLATDPRVARLQETYRVSVIESLSG